MLTSFLPRAFCVLLILQFPIWVVADFMAPMCSQFIYQSSVTKLSAELTADKKVSNKEAAELSHKYHLSWMRVVDNERHVLFNTRPAKLPDIAPLGQSLFRVLEVGGSRFAEVVQPIDGGQIAVGYACPSLLDSLFKLQTWPAQLPIGTILLSSFLNLLSLGAAYWFFVFSPLERLNSKLKLSQDVPEKLPFYVSTEIADNLKYVRERLTNARQENERTVSAARSDLSGAFAREVEDRFISQLSKDIVTMQRTDDVCEKIVQNLSDEFTGIVKAAFGLDADCLPGLRLMNQEGFNEEQAKFFANLKDSPFAKSIKKYESVTVVEVEQLEDPAFRKLAEELGANKFIIAPLSYNGTVLAYFGVLAATKDKQTTKKIDSIFRRMATELSPLWHLVSRYENAFWLSRHDPLTFVRNRISLDETFQTISATPTMPGAPETVFMVFEGDNFRVMLNSFGPRTIDLLIQELVRTLIGAMEHTQRFKRSKLAFADLVYRVGGCRFLLCMEGIGTKRATELANLISKTISEKKDWGAGLPSWSVSCGLVPVVLDELTPQDFLEEAIIALEYVRSRKATGMVVLSKDVPADFMNKALSRNQGGSMKVFNPAGLLQDVAQSGKTGILTVESSQGRVFWAYLEGGLPSKARLGAMFGDYAIIEFASTFVDGSLRLQDLSAVDPHTANELRTLGVEYNVETPLNPLLELAKSGTASAADAKIILKTPELIVHPLIDRQPKIIEKLFSKSTKPVTKTQVDVTNRVWDLCTGRLSLDELVLKLDDCPEALVWTGAGFLMQNKLIKFSRLRVSAHTETAAEKEHNAAVKGTNMTTTIMNFVSGPLPCPNCRAMDALSQKFCVHCGAEMVTAQ